MPASLLVAVDSPLWAEALQALLRRAMPSLRVSTTSLSGATRRAGRARRPLVAVVAAAECSEAALAAIWSLRLRGARTVLLTPPTALPDFARATLPDGVASDSGTGAAFVQVVEAVLRGECRRPAAWTDRPAARRLLSPRESQLMALLTRGLSLKEAATRMGIVYKTADAYRTTLFRKLEVRNRVELILEAQRRGLTGR